MCSGLLRSERATALVAGLVLATAVLSGRRLPAVEPPSEVSTQLAPSVVPDQGPAATAHAPEVRPLLGALREILATPPASLLGLAPGAPRRAEANNLARWCLAHSTSTSGP